MAPERLRRRGSAARSPSRGAQGLAAFDRRKRRGGARLVEPELGLHPRVGRKSPGGRILKDSGPAILVVKPHDVVLAKIGPALNLDELERHLSGIGQPMLRSRRNVGRLILLKN